jgi:hypothetical protein
LILEESDKMICSLRFKGCRLTNVIIIGDFIAPRDQFRSPAERPLISVINWL